MKTSLRRRIPGRRTSQCTVCGELFAGETIGDAHRIGSYRIPGDRRCLTVEEMTAKGWRIDDRGVWHDASRGGLNREG